MTKEEVDIYVARANKSLGQKHDGFVACFQQSYEPVIIAYDFESNVHAEKFIFTRQLIETKFKLQLASPNDCRVLEYR